MVVVVLSQTHVQTSRRIRKYTLSATSLSTYVRKTAANVTTFTIFYFDFTTRNCLSILLPLTEVGLYERNYGCTAISTAITASEPQCVFTVLQVSIILNATSVRSLYVTDVHGCERSAYVARRHNYFKMTM